MTTREFETEVLRVLAVMGCARAEDIALEIATGELFARRVARARTVLATVAHERYIGGQKGFRVQHKSNRYASTYEPAIPRERWYSVTPWQTASGSQPLVVRPVEVTP